MKKNIAIVIIIITIVYTAICTTTIQNHMPSKSTPISTEESASTSNNTIREIYKRVPMKEKKIAEEMEAIVTSVNGCYVTMEFDGNLYEVEVFDPLNYQVGQTVSIIIDNGMVVDIMPW